MQQYTVEQLQAMAKTEVEDILLLRQIKRVAESRLYVWGEHIPGGEFLWQSSPLFQHQVYVCRGWFPDAEIDFWVSWYSSSGGGFNHSMPLPCAVLKYARYLAPTINAQLTPVQVY